MPLRMTHCNNCGWSDYQPADDSAAQARGEQINTTHFHYSISEGIPTCSQCTGRQSECNQCDYPYFGNVEKWRRDN